VPEIAADLGSSILQRLRAAVSPECFQTWFKDLRMAAVDGSTVRLSAPNRYVKFWLESHYKKEVLAAVISAVPDATHVELVLQTVAPATDSSATLGSVLSSVSAPRPQSPVVHEKPVLRETVRMVQLSPRMRLETFAVGKSNRIAHAAAQSVAESPGTVYNPLFLHGAHGLGKTHLMHGIGHLLTERVPPATIVYISCEEFTNAYVSAVQAKRLDAFRARFRNCDALLVDDVQFLGGRERTQEEFLHTFDSLRSVHKQIVLCADVAPRDIKRLDPKLVTRFQTGLVARIDRPDLTLRTDLLREKAEARGLSLAEDVAELLATHIDSNVRELEGAICKLMALAAAESTEEGRKAAPNRELAILSLRELGYLRSGPLSLQDILDATGQRYSVSADDLRSGKRFAALVHARHIGMYLSKTLTSQSVADIGRFYGNRDHATVLHAARKISDLMKRDENVRHEVQTLRQVLGR
jgi:chromosomal replication initiator protein